MAIQYVGGNTGQWAGATSGNTTVSLTALTGGIASSASSGDFVVAAYATGSVAYRTLSITDGTNAYTLVASELYVNRTTDTNLRVAYKRLTGADASVTFGPTGNAADAGAAAVHVWRGVDPTNPLDVAAVTAVASIPFSGRPNPAAITPTTTGAVIIAVGGAAAGTGAVFTSSDLSNFRTATSADTYDAMIGIGSYAWSSGAFDPAQFGGGTTGTGDSWAAVTLALRPEPMQYTMPSASGSFQATGSDAGLLSTRKADASHGAFALTGSAAGGDTEYRQYQFYPGNAFADFAINGAAIHDVADANKTLSVDAGTYAATGGNVTLKVTFVLPATGGSVAEQGGEATLKRTRKITAEAGAYTFAGQDAGLRRTFKLIADAGSVAATGTSANLISTRIARADAGAYLLTGKEASTLCGRVVQSDSGALNFTGFDAEFRNVRSVDAEPGSFTSAGGDAALAIGKVFWVDAGEFSSTGGDAELRRDYKIAPETGEYLVNASDAELFTGVFAVVQDRTFNVKSDRRLFLSLMQDTTMEVPANSRDIVSDPQTRDLHVPHEPRVFIVPKDSRKFAASSGERDFQ